MKKVTIKDIAREAGVSISTASYAINNSGKVSEKTKEKILRVVKEFGYVANTNAKRLKQHKTQTIGIFFDGLFGPTFSELAKGIEKVVHEKGYDLISSSIYGGKNSTAYKYLTNNYVDGAIVLAIKIDDSLIKKAAELGVPIVLLDREMDKENVQSVLLDNYKGAYSATKYLIDCGEKDIFFFSGPEESHHNLKRLLGYTCAMRDHNLSLDKDKIIYGKFTEESGYEGFKSLYEKGIIPKAIFSANDEMAIGIIRACEDLNYDIKNINLIGFDDIREATLVKPRLSTVAYKKSEIGELAAETLFKMLNKKHTTPSKSIIVPTNLILRESTK